MRNHKRTQIIEVVQYSNHKKLSSIPTLSVAFPYYRLKMKFFWSQGFFFINFDSKNEFKSEYNDKNEKIFSWSRNRISQKIDLKAVGPRNSHTDSVEDNIDENYDKFFSRNAKVSDYREVNKELATHILLLGLALKCSFIFSIFVSIKI